MSNLIAGQYSLVIKRNFLSGDFMVHLLRVSSPTIKYNLDNNKKVHRLKYNS